VLARAKWPLLVVAGVLLANLPALIGLVDVNPLVPAGAIGYIHLAGYLPGRWFYDPNIGYTAQALGHLAATDWLHGIVPWWNPYEGLGAPLAGEMQSAALFPPTLLLALPQGQLYFHVCLELIAGLSTWFLVRELGLGPGVAAVGGIMFALNGTFAIFGNAPVNPVAFLPLALLGVERIARRAEWDWNGWLILALAVALAIYAGFPEVVYLYGLLIAAWFVVRLAARPAPGRLRFTAQVACAGGTGLLLAAPIIVAFADYLPNADIGGHAGGFAQQHLALNAVNLVGLPFLYGPIGYFDKLAGHHISWGGGYITPSAIAVGAIGLIWGTSTNRLLRVLLGSSFVLLLMWNYGVPPVAFVFEGVLPIAHDIASDVYSQPVVEMCVVLLACWGLDAIGRDTARRRTMMLVGALLALAVLAGEVSACWGTIVGFYHASSAYLPYALWTVSWAAAAVTLVGLACFLRRHRRAAAIVTGAVLVVDALATFLVPELSAPRSVTADVAPISFLASHLGDARVYTLGFMQANYGSYFDIAQLDVNDLPVPKLWQKYVSGLDPRLPAPLFVGTGKLALANLTKVLPAYEAVGVRYVVAFRKQKVFPNDAAAIDGVRTVFTNSQVVIYELPHTRPYFSTVRGSCSLRGESRLTLTASCNTPATIEMSQLMLPGWSASVDGRPVTVTQSGGYFVAVSVPAGTSQVSFGYIPPHEDLAIVMFGLGVVMTIGVTVAGSLVNRRRRTTLRDRDTEAS
jgi:hypothetical protein